MTHMILHTDKKKHVMSVLENIIENTEKLLLMRMRQYTIVRQTN